MAIHSAPSPKKIRTQWRWPRHISAQIMVFFSCSAHVLFVYLFLLNQSTHALDDASCNHRGSLLSTTCVCHLGWYGEHCQSQNQLLPFGELSSTLDRLDSSLASSRLFASQSAPFLLDYLQQILPAKIPPAMQPAVLKLLLKIASGLLDGQKADGWRFAQASLAKILELMDFAFESPDPTGANSMLVDQIHDAIGACVYHVLNCNAPHARYLNIQLHPQAYPAQSKSLEGGVFLWATAAHSTQFGILSTWSASLDSSVCGFSTSLPPAARRQHHCLEYRCSSTFSRTASNATVDATVKELVVRNPGTKTNSPLFDGKVSFSIPISSASQQQMRDGGRLSCVSYQRGRDASRPSWSEDGCEVVGFNTSYVQCRCSSRLSEFAITVSDGKVVGAEKLVERRKGKSFLLTYIVAATTALAGIAMLLIALRLVLGRRRRERSVAAPPPPRRKHNSKRGADRRDSEVTVEEKGEGEGEGEETADSFTRSTLVAPTDTSGSLSTVVEASETPSMTDLQNANFRALSLSLSHGALYSPRPNYKRI